MFARTTDRDQLTSARNEVTKQSSTLWPASTTLSSSTSTVPSSSPDTVLVLDDGRSWSSNLTQTGEWCRDGSEASVDAVGDTKVRCCTAICCRRPRCAVFRRLLGPTSDAMGCTDSANVVVGLWWARSMERDNDIISGVLDLVPSVDRGLTLVVDEVSAQLSVTSTVCNSIYRSPVLLLTSVITQLCSPKR